MFCIEELQGSAAVFVNSSVSAVRALFDQWCEIRTNVFVNTVNNRRGAGKDFVEDLLRVRGLEFEVVFGDGVVGLEEPLGGGDVIGGGMEGEYQSAVVVGLAFVSVGVATPEF